MYIYIYLYIYISVIDISIYLYIYISIYIYTCIWVNTTHVSQHYPFWVFWWVTSERQNGALSPRFPTLLPFTSPYMYIYIYICVNIYINIETLDADDRGDISVGIHSKLRSAKERAREGNRERQRQDTEWMFLFRHACMCVYVARLWRRRKYHCTRESSYLAGRRSLPCGDRVLSLERLSHCADSLLQSTISLHQKDLVGVNGANMKRQRVSSVKDSKDGWSHLMEAQASPRVSGAPARRSGPRPPKISAQASIRHWRTENIYKRYEEILLWTSSWDKFPLVRGCLLVKNRDQWHWQWQCVVRGEGFCVIMASEQAAVRSAVVLTYTWRYNCHRTCSAISGR